MSTIYDALRKAEERRRLGEAPPLIGDAVWAARRPARAQESRRRWWLLLLVPAVAAALFGAWWLGRGSPAPEPATIATRVEPSVPAAAVPAPTPSATPQVQPAPAAPPLTKAPARPAPQPALASPEPVLAMPATPDDEEARRGVPVGQLQKFERGETFANAPELLRPVTPTPPAPPPPPAAALPQPLAQPADATAASPLVLPPPAAAPPPMVNTPAAIAPPTAVASLPSPPSASSGVPLIYEMPLGTRQTLPPLKMSMHVYAPDPARRVVILDGARFVQGDAVAGELRVAEITPDGVVLELGGQRFLLPRGGR